jgi:hypothetical protein
MQQARKPWRQRTERLAEKSLHIFPTFYCRSKSLEAETPMAVIFDNYRQSLRDSLSEVSFWLRALVVIVWPVAVILSALALTAVNGMFIAQRYHRGILQQFFGQIRLAFAHGMPPIFFYLFELHEPGKARIAHEYLHRAYLKNDSLYKLYYQRRPEQNRRAKVLNDKLSFNQFCRERNLPTVRIYAMIADGAFSWTGEDQRELPQESLFVKPKKGKGGRGTERWTFRNGAYVSPEGYSLGRHELTERLTELSRDRPLLVQKCLFNHPELENLTAGALSTLRMYTMLNERSQPEHIFTMLRMSRYSASVVDNAHRGGIAASVDPETGKLGKATDSGMLARTGWLERHPVTGEQIVGRVVPFWRETLDLVAAAHHQLQSAFVIGWDIGITSDGPRIVEGNKAPDIEIEQRLSGPWGNTRFGELLAYHLQAAAKEGEPQ